ncbi:hypothetical protein ACF0H5_015371 [Mactra antiquata]
MRNITTGFVIMLFVLLGDQETKAEFIDTDSHSVQLKNEVTFTSGNVSMACLRCMCLFSSSCTPFGCQLVSASKLCGYFYFSSLTWDDCDSPGTDFPSCANDLQCSSLCVQRYVQRYAEIGNCRLNCEGFARVFYGGPSGCENPLTLKVWNRLQELPGCKGVR